MATPTDAVQFTEPQSRRSAELGSCVKVQVDVLGTRKATLQPSTPVSRFGLAVRRYEAGKQRDLGSNLLRLSFHFKGCCLWTLSCDLVPLN